ncbi:hypothetical protein CDD82_278 [Ophiocordyceps australis]|uniref:Trafficking protein particle complex subunit 6B n=1 Tax=Ophiocordyceps australis TaxID=1399860 RepID=A0A2C5ZP82_9HYPO|nr:hypothetical protein CDD82_278 [Ophiocordyceps australis]
MSLEPVMPPYNASDPSATFLSSSCLDFLLIELVPFAHRIAQERDLAPRPTEANQDNEDELDAVHMRLESLGYRVGQGLVERFSRDRPRFNDALDVIKFLCKDLWSLVFGKNIDNLKTNHRGVYVLTDNLFRPFSRMSTDAGGQAIVRAQPPNTLLTLAQFLWFPCGVVRGALAALGINSTVQAEISELPGAVFQIKTLSLKS